MEERTIKKLFEQAGQSLRVVLNKLTQLEDNSLKVVTGRITFPATTTGVQSVTVTFAQELPNVPVHVSMTWNDASNGSALTNNYVGKLQVASGSLTEKGFTAQTWRFNAQYNWYATWAAFYYPFGGGYCLTVILKGGVRHE